MKRILFLFLSLISLSVSAQNPGIFKFVRLVNIADSTTITPVNATIYYNEQSHKIRVYCNNAWHDMAFGSGGGSAVSTVFGRAGAVVATAGDYNATQVTYTPAGGIAATTVGGALGELDTEKTTPAYADAKVADAITDGVTTIASSENAVFDALALKQPLDADLTAIAGLTPSNDDLIQRKSGAWINRTIAQVKSDLSIVTYTGGNAITVAGSIISLGGPVASVATLELGASGALEIFPTSDPDLYFGIGSSGIMFKTGGARIFADQASEDIIFTDDRVGSPRGFVYAADYSGTMPDLGMIQKGYVDDKLDLKMNAKATHISYTGNHTLAASDLQHILDINSAGTVTITVPPSVFSDGDQIVMYHEGAGDVVIAQGSGVTVQFPPTGSLTSTFQGGYLYITAKSATLFSLAIDVPAGSSTFVGLTDGPGAFVATNYPRANAAGTALEWRTAAQILADIAAVSTARTISTTAPLTGGGDLSANRTLAISNATTSTVGAASFGASDFDVSSGAVTIDYTNGQASSGSVKGFLSAADFTAFNAKQAAITFGTGVQTALGVNIGSPGAPVLFNGANGTPTSLVLTNAIGLPIAGGGTGVNTLTANGIITGGTTSTGAVQQIAVSNTAGQLLTANASGLPSFQTLACASGGAGLTLVDGPYFKLVASGNPTDAFLKSLTLTSVAVGQVPILYGGLGPNTTVSQGGIPYGSAADVYSILAKNTNSTRYLSNTGASNSPAWAQIDLSNGITGDLPFANLTQVTARSVLGVAGNTTADVAAIQGTANQVLIQNSGGTGVSFGQVNLASSAAVIGTLPVGNGGTGLTAVDGTYTPTLNGVSNVAASTAYVTGWYRVGSMVTVFGKIDIDATLAASTATELGVSLPIASNMTGEEDLGGNAISDSVASLSARIKADPTNDRAAIVFKALSLTNDSYSFEFSYQVK